MTLEQRARELVSKLLSRHANDAIIESYVERIVAAMRAVRDEALEEAAAVIEQCNRDGPYHAIGAATPIRALRSTPPNPIDDAEFGTAEWRRDHPEPPREPDNGTGFLEVTANASEVIVNLPRDMIGHIKFTPAQAALLANSLIAKAHIAIALAKTGTSP